jgi:hypothetical protein
MTTSVRLQALQQYGGIPPRCAWCGTTTGPFELDHLRQDGAAHRAHLAS